MSRTPARRRLRRRGCERAAQRPLRKSDREVIEKAILAWSDAMERGTAAIKSEMAGWEEAKEQVRKENAGLTDKQRSAAELQRWADNRVKQGTMTSKERADFIDTFITKSVRLNAAS